MNYPGILERVKALFIDQVIIIGLMMAGSYTFSAIGNIPDEIRISLFVFILFYDPLFTSFAGGTLGHRSIGLRVRSSSNESKNINIFQALLRYALKIVLGWLSMLTVMRDEKKKAIHDMASGSVVIKLV